MKGTLAAEPYMLIWEFWFLLFGILVSYSNDISRVA